MVSSPGFVSNPCDCRPIQTRFRFASGCRSLKLATEINSQAHSPKGTPSERIPKNALLRPVVSIQFQLLFHYPRRGSFQLSLTVLVRYRSSSVFSLGRWTSQFPTELACSVVLRIPRLLSACVYGTLTFCGGPSQILRLRLPAALLGSYYPGVHVRRFGLLRFRSPLLAECCLFLGVLRCFSSPGSLRWTITAQGDAA